jgi:hypothetical protein
VSNGRWPTGMVRRIDGENDILVESIDYCIMPCAQMRAAKLMYKSPHGFACRGDHDLNPEDTQRRTAAMHPITVEASPVAVAAELDTRLGQFNEEQVGPRNTLDFVLSVRDGQGELVGGSWRRANADDCSRRSRMLLKRSSSSSPAPSRWRRATRFAPRPARKSRARPMFSAIAEPPR